MLYLDSNVFVHAAVDQGPRGARASDVLRSVAQGEVQAFTSALTVDEVVYALRRLVNRKAAIEKGHQILAYPNLRVVAIGPEEIRASLRLMERHETLGPRDAVHAAAAFAGGADKIVTDDSDFDGVRGLKRQALS